MTIGTVFFSFMGRLNRHESEVIPIKTPVSRVGNKTSILHILYALFPLNYGRFIDVFGGSGSVLLGNPTVSSFEVYSNITDDAFLVFGVKGLMDTNKRLKDAMLFNILSYMSNQLLGVGNTAASIDELYLFLTNMTAIEYIRNASKRVRKKESSVILASQNI